MDAVRSSGMPAAGSGAVDVPGVVDLSGVVAVPGVVDLSGVVDVPGVVDLSGVVDVPGVVDGVVGGSAAPGWSRPVTADAGSVAVTATLPSRIGLPALPALGARTSIRTLIWSAPEV